MRRIVIASTAFLFASLLTAATPPPLINYEGVLRNSANAPLTGNFDMVFRFLDPGSNEVLVDRHTASLGGQVSVSGGLFNVPLGSGNVIDGTGPGTYTSLDQVFRDYGTVYLQITIGTETLTPSLQIVSAPYALNATNLAGKDASKYLDTSTTAQTKSGPLNISTTSTTTALDVNGAQIAGHFISGPNEAFVADGSGGRGLGGSGYYGVEGIGESYGGYFHNSTTGANSGTVGLGGATIGMYALVNSASGYTASFTNASTGTDTTIGQSGLGIRSYIVAGTAVYGYTSNGTGLSGDGGNNGIGVSGVGVEGGAFFSNVTSSYGRVGTSTYKIQGTGAVSFVQNHPFDKKKVIVYASPEGDEVAVYTRGSARLENGEARVALGETFQWVTNPDIGLTAHLTPRGAWSQLYVASVTPTELVVKSAGGDPAAAFDYVVQGLRIGFEEVSIVQEKQRESYIPSMAEHRQLYAQHPDLRAYDALERFKAMPGAARAAASDSGDGAAASALKNAIHEYDPSVDGPVSGLKGFAAAYPALARPEAVAVGVPPIAARVARDPKAPEVGIVAVAAPAEPSLEAAEPQAAAERVPGSAAGAVLDRHDVDGIDRAVMLPVAGIVEPGDVLVADAESAGSLRRGSMAADPAVIGVAAGPSDDGHAAVVTSGVVLCKVDAGYGAVRPGDLLTASPTPGHAMKHAEALAGTILGKALERLDEGARVIKILLTVR